MRDYSSKRAAVWKELRVPVTGFQSPNMTSKEDKVAVGRVRMGVESTMMSRFGRVRGGRSSTCCLSEPANMTKQVGSTGLLPAARFPGLGRDN